MIEKGTWVKVEKVLLKPEERTAKIPPETKKVPYVIHVCGFLKEKANIGDEATIISKVGREHTGKLIESEPSFKHNFGDFVQELVDIGCEVRKELEQLNE
ncbi:MAG: 2-amino-4-ketopentanoate thiolase [Spirochaetes bacterium]|nr:2-amino-4-ketopentanoate thiolase [Spirochaetota bacterium]NLJ04188.1 2-amino-4-ketopentanoate thiolase [Exilispira sp.]MBP8991927.1 2-amino-4-ketopentanoate thiolase [Spirochaetota bacterium]HNV44688.1 2-amino-4-oxopentanoate thiolase subunit OrtA [Exilispira sp.]HPB47881.1 2-amino-4-oxopentanoate thiolase subunit OrtA [Exilispira sp.]